MYLRLFTNAGINSGVALFQRLCWSIAFGLIARAVSAFLLYLLAPLDCARRLLAEEFKYPRSELPITATELNAIAAPAMIELSSNPNVGY